MREAFKLKGQDIEQAKVAVQGFGNVGSYAAFMLRKWGQKWWLYLMLTAVWLIKRMSKKGIDIKALKDYTKERGTIQGFSSGAEEIPRDELFGQDYDILAPCALENAITTENVGQITADIIVEGANGPTTSEVAQLLLEIC